MTPTALVLEEDDRSRPRLLDLLGSVHGLRVVDAARAADLPEAVDELEPDLLILGVTLPASIERAMASCVRHGTKVVVTTAGGHYAVAGRAVGAANLAQAVAEALAGPDEIAADPEGGGSRRPRRSDDVDRLFLRDRDTIWPVRASDIVRCEADGDYVKVQTTEESFLGRFRLQDLEERLVGAFMRVHRSHLVNLDHVVRFEPHDDARLAAVLSDGARIVASRARSRELRRIAH